MNTRQKIEAVIKQHPDWGRVQISRATGIPTSTVQGHLIQLGHKGKQTYKDRDASLPGDTTDPKIKLIGLIRKEPKALSELSEALSLSEKDTKSLLKDLAKTFNIVNDSSGRYIVEPPPFGYLPLEVMGKGWTKVGLVSDTHLCCREERLEALHLQYDLFESEGITQVFHAGNIVDGYIQKINGASVIVTTVDGQIQYVIDNYPQRKGITTYFITGDDHESWFMQQGLNFGKYLQMCAEVEGRSDLQYLGHVEADVEFITSNGKSCIMKVSHPGGGSSYARSYTGQKTVESYEGGEKPNILIHGHFHLSNYMMERNVHVISLPGFQDQTIFARKKRLRMEVGGAILKFMQSPKDGTVTRLSVEWNRYFDRSYYKAFLRSDAQLVKGHLKINTK